ncbi:Spore germination protein YaaH [bioreactor metagenome]|uniref:Spore germination protein YaaH n=1 Tax=bioreactor metagenome TaxID=1076179 RepID=A0A645FSR8_9ZZZZ
MDHVIIMTYEWGYTYGPAMAVSPINEVRRVINYATSVIPSEKILMGMPNYGYDWTLPFVRGSAARSLSNTQAVELALKVGANIQYDAMAQAPFFYYYDSAGKRHVVWFDDARSIEARLKLINQYDLGGASYWTINSFFPQNWLVLSSLYNVRKVL